MMWHDINHMLSGKSAAAKSHKTPKHLVPHLQSQVNNMKHGKSLKGLAGNSPTTAQPKFKPPAKIGGGTAMNDGSTGQAEQQISAAPLPFQNPRGVANLPAGRGSNLGVGTGVGANSAGVKGSKAPVHPPTGPTGGYKPKKNHPPSGMSKFYGSR